jgi:Fuc2NAc and GlcNAc transferase
MPHPDMLVLALCTLTASFGLTWLIRRYALARNVLDVPNERSSHTVATPRGGGLAIVVAFLASVLGVAALTAIDARLLWAVFGGGIAVAGVGFLDDHGAVWAGHRLAVHVLASAWALWWLGELPPTDFGFGAVELGWFGSGLALLFLVWFLNLYNFMDGIDGIAGVEAIAIAGSATLILYWRGAPLDVVMLPTLLAAAAGGFLIWNWPPARIFMGDVGSGFLGLVIGILALSTVNRGFLTVWVWLILFGAFFVDATVTLFRRVARGERAYEAHRSHAYQRLARHWGTHLPVTLCTLGIDLLWLLPLACAAAYKPSMGAALTIVAWTPLALGAWRAGAGLPGNIRA